MWRDDGALIVRADRVRGAAALLLGVGAAAIGGAVVQRGGLWGFVLLLAGVALAAASASLLVAPPRLVVARDEVELRGKSVPWGDVDQVQAAGPEVVFVVDGRPVAISLRLMNAPRAVVLEAVERWSGRG